MREQTDLTKDQLYLFGLYVETRAQNPLGICARTLLEDFRKTLARMTEIESGTPFFILSKRQADEAQVREETEAEHASQAQQINRAQASGDAPRAYTNEPS